MKFEWDSKKNEINIRECGIDFADAMKCLMTIYGFSQTTERIMGKRGMWG